MTFLIGFSKEHFSQVNGYARVTSVTGNVLTLSNAYQVYDSLKNGKRIIIIQMQGATVSNTTNSSAFGSLNSLGSTGLYETAFISAINPAASSATLSGALMNTYDPSAMLQIVTYPTLGSTNYSTSTNLTPVAWNGTIGGVLAFSVNGNLILNDNITADGMGFRGGAKAGSDGSNCSDTIWRNPASSVAASKGEGVYITSGNERAGKAKAVNGGGAGTVHNGGGGGGGNATAGGEGFYGFPGSGCSATVSAAGQGGIAITSNLHRVFMGGGGGGGQENNGTGTNGGNGGGIILIKADTIIATNPCFPVAVSANGAAAANSGNDGAGGGGAGGTIVLDVKDIRIASACPLSISSNGGNGGSVGNATSHGAGGGGGQGVILVTGAGGFSNTIFTTVSGQGGAANTSGSPKAANGAGTAGSGIVFGAGSLALPIMFHSVNAETVSDNVVLTWESQIESSEEYFEILHTTDGLTWTTTGRVAAGAGDSLMRKYSFTHTNASPGDNYYQVIQVHNPESRSYSKVMHVSLPTETKSGPYPNPGADIIEFSCSQAESEGVAIFDAVGNDVTRFVEKRYDRTLTMNTRNLPDGIFFLSNGVKRYKIIIKR